MGNPLDGMTYLEKLEYLRDQALERLAQALEKPNPNYSIDGERYDWASYTEMLRKQVKGYNDLIEEGDPDGDPFEIVSQGFT